MPRPPMIQANAAHGIVEAIKRAGGSPQRIFKEAGLDPVVLEDCDARITLRRFVALFEIAAERTGDDCFGLRFGMTYDPRDAGLLAYLVLNSATLGESLQSLVRYLRIRREGTVVALDLTGDRAFYSCRIDDPAIPRRRQDSERIMALLMQVIRILTWPDWRPREVHFEHAEPAATTVHQGSFEAPVHFGRHSNGLVFDRELLEHEIEAADLRLLRVLERYVDELMAQLPGDDSLISSIRELLTASLHDGQPNIESAARDLGMSVRTLQRRLRDLNVSFSYLLTEVRYNLAIKYLADRDLAVSQIAYLLGYSELSAFDHAFHRWSGMTPLEYRRRQAD